MAPTISKSIFAFSATLSIIVSFVLGHGIAHAEIYKHTNKQGLISFTDRPVHNGYIKLQKTWKGWVELTTTGNYRRNKERFKPYISSAARRYTLSPDLISAVIHTESYYNPTAISRAGAVGLMQLMPATAQRYDVYNRKNPQQNIDGGVRYLKDLIKMFDNDIKLALAAYNAGENTVKRYGYKIPPYPETQKYVTKVLRLYKQYETDQI